MKNLKLEQRSVLYFTMINNPQDYVEGAAEVMFKKLKQKAYRNGYVAGYKDGSQDKMVWHDYDAGEDCYEDSHEGRWIRRETEKDEIDNEVIAWCDIPKFDN